MTDKLTPEARLALEQGNKILAIKLVRQAHGIGLKEAKGVVDSELARDSHLANSYELKKPNTEPLKFFALFILLGLLGFYVFRTF